MTGTRDLGESVLGTRISGERRKRSIRFVVCWTVGFLLSFWQDMAAGVARLLHQGWIWEAGILRGTCIRRIFLSVDPECWVVGPPGQASIENLGVIIQFLTVVRWATVS